MKSFVEWLRESGLERYAAGPPEDFGAYTTYCGT